MIPTINPGQNILASKLPYLFNQPKINDIIIFKSEKKLIIKRIKNIKDGQFKVAGDNALDSKDFGFIDKSKILGKVIFFW